MAQLVRRPVVATDREGAEDVVVDGTGTIVSPSHDPLAVARVLDQYRRDPERRAREGEEARRHAVGRYDRRLVEARFEEILREAAGAG